MPVRFEITPRYAALFPLLAGLVFLAVTYSGVWGVAENRSFDGSVLYLAATAWLDGQSAYDRAAYEAYFLAWQEQFQIKDRFERNIFVSPPTVAPLGLLMAQLPWTAAIIALEVLQIIALVFMCFFAARLSDPDPTTPLRVDAYTLTVSIVACCFGAVTATMLFGQLGILAITGGLGAIYAWRVQRPVLMVAMILLASVKPQVSIMLLVFLLGAGQWRALIVAAAVALGLLAALEAPSGLLGLAERYAGALQAYAAHPFNGDPAIRIGLGGLLRSVIDPSVVFAVTILAGVALSVWLGARTARDDPRLPEVVMALLILGVICVPLFSYDFIAGSALLVMSRYWRAFWIRGLVLCALIASSKPNGIENRVVTAETPILGIADGYVMQLLVIGSLLFVGAIALGHRWLAPRN